MLSAHYNDKGMTPIAKNINVIDEYNRKYESTYPKRARGLVKKGRARFIDETTICLVTSPGYLAEGSDTQEDGARIGSQENFTFEKGMSLYGKDSVIEMTYTENNINETKETVQKGSEVTDDIYGNVTVEYILQKISEISSCSDYIQKMFNTFESIDFEGMDDPDIAEQIESALSSVAQVAILKEQTNLRILMLYEKIYNDLTIKQRIKDIEDSINSEMKNNDASIDGIIGKSFPATYLDNVKIATGAINLDELEKAYRIALGISLSARKYNIDAASGKAELDCIVDKSYMEYYFVSVKLTKGHVNLQELEAAYKAACRISAIAQNSGKDIFKRIDKSFMDFYFENVKATGGRVDVNDLERVYKINYMIV